VESDRISSWVEGDSGVTSLINTLLVVLILSSCAPLPGGKFLPGITTETSLKDIPDLDVHEVALPVATIKCHGKMFKERPIFTVLFFGGIWACADVIPDGKGGVRRCEVWAPSFLLKHELEHCKGWADRWY